MKTYKYLSLGLMILTLSFSVSDVYLHGNGKGERYKKYSYKWGKRTKKAISLEGKIKKQADFGPTHSILLETTKGDIYANLGSTRRIKSKGLKLVIGDKIKLQGFYIEKSRYGKILIPLELTKDSKTYRLMSKKFWKGSRRRWKRWDDDDRYEYREYDDDRYEYRDDDDRYEYRDDDDRYEYREYDDDYNS